MSYIAGKGRQAFQRLPVEYRRLRYEYVDDLLRRAQQTWRHQDIERLWVIYGPVADAVQVSLMAIFGRHKADAVEDAVRTEFMALIKLYSFERKDGERVTFANYLQKWLSKRAKKLLNKFEAPAYNKTSARSRATKTEFFSQYTRTNGEQDQGLSALFSSKVDLSCFDTDAKDNVNKGIRAIRDQEGEAAAEMFLLRYMYGFATVEIAELTTYDRDEIEATLVDAVSVFERFMKEQQCCS